MCHYEIKTKCECLTHTCNNHPHLKSYCKYHSIISNILFITNTLHPYYSNKIGFTRTLFSILNKIKYDVEEAEKGNVINVYMNHDKNVNYLIELLNITCGIRLDKSCMMDVDIFEYMDETFINLSFDVLAEGSTDTFFGQCDMNKRLESLLVK